MNYKWKSRKLWVMIIASVLMIVMLYLGKVTSHDFTGYLQWALGIFCTTNVVQKFTGKESNTNGD